MTQYNSVFFAAVLMTKRKWYGQINEGEMSKWYHMNTRLRMIRACHGTTRVTSGDSDAAKCILQYQLKARGIAFSSLSERGTEKHDSDETVKVL